MAEDGPKIEERENGPLMARGISKMVGPDGAEIAVKPVMALCRCGHSKNKPFCDGSHKDAGFRDRGGKPEGPDRVFSYAGQEVTVTFNPRLCSHAAECGRIAQNIFNPSQKPWVQPDNGTRAEVEAVVAACPSGALKLAEGQDKGPDLFADRAEITVQRNGPYWVQGVTAPQPPQGAGMSDRKYVLCRCGQSGAKPYCDGSHRDRGWKSGD
ncbi:CDGSH iron-sulfur domain-containing protein [Fluviibacterium sp. DFM31]|uniref:CDGSH iron-sulfur domain-containing protein n=1 Tax=Meridianimarinicoccus marinus TaxID=3231483 RepID=A0ABV3L8T2_9RHOB